MVANVWRNNCIINNRARLWGYCLFQSLYFVHNTDGKYQPVQWYNRLNDAFDVLWQYFLSECLSDAIFLMSNDSAAANVSDHQM